MASFAQGVQEEEEKSSTRQKGRQKVAPKMGKIDIDYKTLHDAFFKFQTRPPLSAFGSRYHEGKEHEQTFGDSRPGHIGPALRAALGMTDNMPVPWLINQQRFGPPPAYPNLKIPGLNAPLPEGAVPQPYAHPVLNKQRTMTTVPMPSPFTDAPIVRQPSPDPNNRPSSPQMNSQTAIRAKQRVA